MHLVLTQYIYEEQCNKPRYALSFQFVAPPVTANSTDKSVKRKRQRKTKNTKESDAGTQKGTYSSGMLYALILYSQNICNLLLGEKKINF